MTVRSDSAPVVDARHAFWHPVRGAGVRGGGVPGVFASLDPRLMSEAPSGHLMRRSWVDPVDGGLWLEVQRRGKPGGSSPRTRHDTSPKGMLIPARGWHLRCLPRVSKPRRTPILKGLLKRVAGGIRGARRVSLIKESLQDSVRFLGPVTRGSRCASTPGWIQVPLQGTCRWMSWATPGDGFVRMSAQRADTEVRRRRGTNLKICPGREGGAEFPRRW